MSRLQRGDNSFGLRQQCAGLQGFRIGCRNVFGAACILEPRVLRPNGRIIKSRRNRMGRSNLAGVVLQNVGISSLQHARRPTTETCSMFAELLPTPTGLHANESHLLILEKLVENADGVGASADASDDSGRQLALSFQNLRP